MERDYGAKVAALHHRTKDYPEVGVDCRAYGSTILRRSMSVRVPLLLCYTSRVDVLKVQFSKIHSRLSTPPNPIFSILPSIASSLLASLPPHCSLSYTHHAIQLDADVRTSDAAPCNHESQSETDQRDLGCGSVSPRKWPHPIGSQVLTLPRPFSCSRATISSFSDSCSRC